MSVSTSPSSAASTPAGLGGLISLGGCFERRHVEEKSGLVCLCTKATCVA